MEKIHSSLNFKMTAIEQIESSSKAIFEFVFFKVTKADLKPCTLNKLDYELSKLICLNI